MSPDPHVVKLLDNDHPCADHSPVTGKLVCVLHARAANRGLELCPHPSRAVQRGEIHELILTAESDAAPGKTVNAIAYLGYFEVLEGGVMWVGDRACINGRQVGVLAGCDLTHFPNHMNIVLKTGAGLFTGAEAGYHPGVPLSFEFSPEFQE
jgi:hypothetical protein